MKILAEPIAKMVIFALTPSCLGVFFLLSCGMCSDKIEAEKTSPDGILTATQYVRNCGATTDFSTIVSIHRPDNTYRDDDDVTFVMKGRSALTIIWSGPRQLTIQCGECQRQDVFRQVTKLGNVDISYSQNLLSGSEKRE